MATRPISASAMLESEHAHYVDWGAIFGGVAVAAGISIVLFAFGSAIGFSMTSPYEGEGVSKAVYLTVLGLWTLWVVVSSFMAGGYIAGRLRKRVGDATEHEIDVRDGVHGLIVWGLGVVVASMLLVIGVAGVVGGSAKMAAAAADDSRTDPIGYAADALFRSTERSPSAAASEAERKEVALILVQGTVRGEVTQDNKAYISRLVAARTGLSQAEAERRVDNVLTEAKRKIDTARKTGIVVGFLTAAALLIAAAAAAWSATLGGRHRDQGSSDVSYFWRWQ